MNTTSIKADFQSNTNFRNDNEVDLFRELADSICRNSNSFFIDETHGRVAQVEFKSSISGTARCEVSDLLIISKLSNANSYRATFWQAKKEVNPKWPPPRGDQNFDFKGQFNQWELLSKRPVIKGMGKFKPDPNLLSQARSPSIGSFGVFYDDGGLTEVNYSVAEMVSASSVAAHTKLVINENLSNYNAWEGEVIVSHNLSAFLEALFNFTIGSPLDPTSRSDRWLMSYVAGKCKANNINNFIVDDADLDMPNVGGDRDGISILLVNTEIG